MASPLSGIDLGRLFNDGAARVAEKGADLQNKMEALLKKESVNQEDLLVLQFEMGQYNAMVETLSTVTKSLTDMLKNLAQRTG